MIYPAFYIPLGLCVLIFCLLLDMFEYLYIPLLIVILPIIFSFPNLR